MSLLFNYSKIRREEPSYSLRTDR